ncbi:MAG: FecR domain-containing protein [Bacteroidetes bacterium]|nr:FecR domain-containing protein [Bacteroidota bacterium]MBU1373374.1 FecR domain-containing protein [Bacteroidota bacterium]MBU1485644.1 FecR domain-containing protein [Bacteroidota bacterium]MBU1760221.1 FecR domain-containing protein [Bacteroidota bacterium]MBU2045967.1 FecR domain-containing protein [Bacteroidota bacterium]
MSDFNINEEESFYISLIIQEREGTISPEDAERLLEWRSLTPENNALYNDISKIESNLSLLEKYQHLNTEKSLASLHKKLQHYEAENKPKHQTLKLSNWLAIAASLFLVLSAIFYIQHSLDTVTLKTAAFETKQFILPDQSRVTLNNNTLITYSKNNFKDERRLNLINGECFLDVVHNPTQPFSIHYKKLSITDIGTSFNVEVLKNKVNVAVNSGEVKLSIKDQPTKAFVKAGEAAYYQIEEKTIKKTVIKNKNYKAYADQNIYFKNTSLSEVVKTLESVYHQKIVLKNTDLNARKFTGEFKKQRLNDIILVIAETLNLKVTHEEGKICFK